MSSARTGDINKDDYMSPLWLYELLHKEFHFVLDTAASEENALCDFYFDKEADGLKSDWFGNSYTNPPYSQLYRWVMKGKHEATHNKKVEHVVMLIPARTDTKAWWDAVRYGEVRFLPGRLKFRLGIINQEIVRLKNIERMASGKSALDPEKTSAPFPSAIVVFRGAGKVYTPKTVYWNVREPTHAT